MTDYREGSKGSGEGIRLSLGVLVSGRGTNLQAILEAAATGRIPAAVRVVVSDNPKAQALKRAEKYGIPAVVVQPGDCRDRQAFDRRLIDTLVGYRVDLVCLAGFMRVLGPQVVQAFRGRIMNIHPSLLPAFPGLDAQRQALEYGVKVAGCTVHFVDEGVDTGPIILQAAVPVREDDDVESLAQRILEHEHRTYIEAIRLYAEGRLRIEGRCVKILDASIR